MRAASAAGTPLAIVGGGTKAWYGRQVVGERLDVSGHRGVIDYQPSERVITARAGTPLAEIEARLAAFGQHLAFEPPRLGAASTIGGVVASGLSGPARPFAGAVRDSLLGVTLLNGRGETLRFGGTVFKNVAGFDLFRLQGGALGSFGVLLDVSLRVAPAPASSLALSFEMPWSQGRGLARDPSLPLTGASHDGERLHLRLAGSPIRLAALQTTLGGELGSDGFWDQLRDLSLPRLRAPRLWRVSLPPNATPPVGALLDWAGAQAFVDQEDRPRVEHGHVSLVRGAAPGEAVFDPLPEPMMALHRRLKAVFDPAGVFNPGRMYEGL